MLLCLIAELLRFLGINNETPNAYLERSPTVSPAPSLPPFVALSFLDYLRLPLKNFAQVDEHSWDLL
jgi:hypothetical protein